MQKRNKHQKASRKTNRKYDGFVNENNLIQPILEPQIERNSVLLKLAKNPNFVGAMDWMLKGCFACGGFITVLFAFPALGRLFEQTTYQIASFIPKKFIPPGTYIPGIMSLPVWLLIIIGFTVYGYKKEGVPPEIEIKKDTRSLSEKLAEFVILLTIALVIGYFRTREDHQHSDLIQIISQPVFVIFTIIIILGGAFYVFSRNQSQQFLLFVLYSALPIGFVLFILGLIVHTIFDSFFYVLSQ